MAIPIPSNFDYKTIKIDPIETVVRDQLNVNIENWAKFRYTISIAVNANTLKSSDSIPQEVKSSYVELGKSHYEIVTMLGATKISLNNLLVFICCKDHLQFKKSFKEFYMHAGSVLDNLARLIYIVNVSNSPGDKDGHVFKRHSIGYGLLKATQRDNPNELKGYTRIIHNKTMTEIKIIRNNFTHGWPPTIFIHNNVYLWPTAMRKKGQYYPWPHDPEEKKMIKVKNRKKIPIRQMIEMDWKSLENFQNDVFGKLVHDIKKFERNHKLIIGQ